MERDPFSSFESDNSPEKRDKDSKSEKKSEKSRSSFIDDLLDRRHNKEKVGRSGSDEDEPSSLAEFFSKKGSEEGGGDSKKETEPSKKDLAKEFLEHRADELREEVEEAGNPADATEAQIDLELVEAITDKIDNPDAEVEPAVEEAYNELMEAIDELDANEAEEAAGAGEGADPEATIDVSETAEDTTEADDSTLNPTTTSPPVSTGGSGSTGGGSSGTTPPPPPPNNPPPPPNQPANNGRPTPIPIPVPVPGPNHNQAPTTTTPESSTDRRRHVAGKVIVAGAVGYMIGRRGGRKRAEGKLMPEIKKRDEEIVDLKRNVAEKEFNIRQAARSHEEQMQKAVDKAKEEGSKEAQQNIVHVAHEQQVHEQAAQEEAVVTRRVEQAAQKEEERAGEEPRIEMVSPIQESRVDLEKAPDITKHIETVPTPVLLHMAEKIKVLDTNVKKLYETNQIDRHGLEEIVKEHLKGHDIAHVLDKRLLGKEAIRDRAHEYRHDPTFMASADDDSPDSDEQTKPQGPDKKVLATHEHTPAEANEHTPLNIPTHDPNQVPPADKAEEKPKQTKTTVAIAIAVAIAVGVVLLLFSF